MFCYQNREKSPVRVVGLDVHGGTGRGRDGCLGGQCGSWCGVRCVGLTFHRSAGLVVQHVSERPKSNECGEVVRQFLSSFFPVFQRYRSMCTVCKMSNHERTSTMGRTVRTGRCTPPAAADGKCSVGGASGTDLCKALQRTLGFAVAADEGSLYRRGEARQHRWWSVGLIGMVGSAL